ncbi:MAG: hypothetical protein ABI944_05675 [Chthoniobacterales bacterium]
MRTLAALLLFSSGVAALQGQQQESKLLDRVLKPDMSLQNSAQSKRFTTASSTVNKPAYVKDFYTDSRSMARPFSAVKNFFARQFASHNYAGRKEPADLSTRSEVTNTRRELSTRTASRISETWDARKSVATLQFAGERPFLGRGKSQKALSAHDTPMTIDQVRELLNKNK